MCSAFINVLVSLCGINKGTLNFFFTAVRWPQAEPSLRLQVLLEALGVTEASLSHLLPQLRLPVAVTCYWLRRAQPRPEERLLKALLLGLSDRDALRHRDGNKRKQLSGLFSAVRLSDQSAKNLILIF